MTDLPELLPAPLRAALLAVSAGDAVVVGGYVRDQLLGRSSADLDLTVSGNPAPIARQLAARLGGVAFALGADHAIHRVTLRTPVESVRHLDIATRRGTVAADLARRDFTVNALGWSVGETALIDPLGGLADLHAGRLRLASDGAVRDDPLRALRAVRFVATLGFTLDEPSAAIIRRDAGLLPQAAGERQRDELVKVLDTPVAGAMLRLADGLGLIDVLFPESIAAKGCIQPKEHYYDVFDHLVETVAVLDMVLHEPPETEPQAARHRLLWAVLPGAEALRFRYTEQAAEGRTYRALLKLTGFLHDISKPETKAMIGGRIRFFGHDDRGAQQAAAILERLRFTSRETRLVELLIKEHMRPGQLAAKHQLPSRRALYRFYRDLGEAAPDLLLLNLADHAAARGPLLSDEAWAGHAGYIRWLLEQRAPEQGIADPPKLLTGHDLLRELALPAGPLIGVILEAVREAQAGGRITTRDGALRLARRLAQAAQQPAGA